MSGAGGNGSGRSSRRRRIRAGGAARREQTRGVAAAGYAACSSWLKPGRLGGAGTGGWGDVHLHPHLLLRRAKPHPLHHGAVIPCVKHAPR
ncbi:hypothetical protein BRADI_1g60394v3 [Brachypodium distachyon]|uniref:Uncharacterized protein n=1 Tax=Brachypodium distachyon TaxID=15368 RepID=A0A0Q3LEI1_BRADI|nr:hypothetical protein BRADI_1g60394v3 [Brachypodium distachyon]